MFGFVEYCELIHNNSVKVPFFSVKKITGILFFGVSLPIYSLSKYGR